MHREDFVGLAVGDHFWVDLIRKSVFFDEFFQNELKKCCRCDSVVFKVVDQDLSFDFVASEDVRRNFIGRSELFEQHKLRSGERGARVGLSLSAGSGIVEIAEIIGANDAVLLELGVIVTHRELSGAGNALNVQLARATYETVPFSGFLAVQTLFIVLNTRTITLRVSLLLTLDAGVALFPPFSARRTTLAGLFLLQTLFLPFFVLFRLVQLST